MCYQKYKETFRTVTIASVHVLIIGEIRYLLLTRSCPRGLGNPKSGLQLNFKPGNGSIKIEGEGFVSAV